MSKAKGRKDSFVVYRSFYEATKKLDYETLGKFFLALCEYSLDQKKPKVGPELEGIFILIMPQIDANYRKWIASSKGGAPKGSIRNPEGRNQYSKEEDVIDRNTTGIQEDNHGITTGMLNDIVPVDVSVNEECGNVHESVDLFPHSHEGNPIISLPLNKVNTYKPIYEEDLTYYSGLYPNVDILQEFRNMVGWLNANPTRKKTAKGIDKFINNWLMGKQDQGRVGSFPRTSGGSLSVTEMQQMKGELE